MQVTLEIPETLAQSLGYDSSTLPRRALEALLVDEWAQGKISRGKVAEVLGLSFQEAEERFRSRQIPYPAKTAEDDARVNTVLLKNGKLKVWTGAVPNTPIEEAIERLRASELRGPA